MPDSIELPLYPEDYHLATPRLLLQPPHEDHIEGLWPHVTDAALTRFLAWEPHRDKNETQALVDSLAAAQKAGKGFHWVVCKNHEVIGLVSLIDVRRSYRSFTWNRAELAYWIGTKYQGQGYAAEACKAITGFGFSALGLHKITVDHAAGNPASGRIAEKLGFRLVGVEREAFCKHGTWHDLMHYEMLEKDFTP